MTPRASILIPAYNEEEGLPRTIQQLVSCPELADCEIIVVDDGSKDGTNKAANAFPTVKMIRHRCNKGYGSAIKTGCLASTGGIIAWFDADGQHRVEDLCRILDQLNKHDLDYCIGARNSESHQVSNRKLGKFILKSTVEWAAGEKIPDFNSGLRAFRREVLLRYLHLLPKGFGASTTTTILMIERDYNGENLPITVLERIGKSSVKQLRDGSRTLMIVLRLVLLFKPLQIFATLGLIMIAVGLGYNLTLTDRNGFSVLASVVIGAGIQSIMLGLVCDQISAMRRERFERHR